MGNTTIPAELVAINAISGTLIADNAITSVHIAQNNITATQIATGAVSALQIAGSTITSAKIADGTIVTADIADGQITTGKLADSSVTTAKIADGTIVGGDIANNAILTQHIDDNQITADQIADNAVGIGQLAGIARGKIIVGDSAGNPALLALGAANTLLQSDGTDIVFAPLQSGIDDNSNAVAITIDSSEKVGIGETSPLGKLHIKEQDSGQGSVNANFDQLVLEDDSHSGMTILSGTSGDGGIYFGDSGGNNMGQFKYKHSTNAFEFTTNNGNAAMTISSAAKVGIGTTSPLAQLEIDPPAADTAIFAIRRQDHATVPLFKIVQDSSVSQGTGHCHITSSNRDMSITAGENLDKTKGLYIKTTGNVGIGTTAPAYKLHQSGTGLQRFQIDATDNNANGSGIYLKVLNSGSAVSQSTITIDNVGNLKFFTGTSSEAERVRIDASGFAVFGGTAQGAQNALTISQAGYVQARVTGTAGYFDRLGSDGNIIELRKDGSAFGSIGVRSSTLQIGTGNTQLAFSDADDAFFVKNEAGTARNGSHDLGKSNAKFKDIYFSGALTQPTEEEGMTMNIKGSIASASFTQAGGSSVSQRTRRLIIPVLNLRTVRITLIQSGHMFNDGNSFYSRETVFDVMQESTNLRINNRTDVNLLGNNTGKIGVPDLAVSSSLVVHINTVIGSQVTHACYVKVEGLGANGITSIGNV